MSYRLRLRESVATGHSKFWGCKPRGQWSWQAGAFAYHYPYKNDAEIAAKELVPKYGPIDVVTIDGKEVSVWEDAREFQRRVDEAVAKAKEQMRRERKTSTWVGGVAPDYYKIDLPVLGVTVMPFDIIDALKMNFNLGCVVKYVLRAGRKGPALDDLKKARNCLDREIQRVEAEAVAK